MSDEWLERIAATSPAGPPCPTCGGETRLVILRGMWCPRCKMLRTCPDDTRGTCDLFAHDRVDGERGPRPALERPRDTQTRERQPARRRAPRGAAA